MALPFAFWNAFGGWFGPAFGAACTFASLDEVCEDLLVGGAHLVGPTIVVDGVTGILGVFAVRVAPIQGYHVLVAKSREFEL